MADPDAPPAAVDVAAALLFSQGRLLITQRPPGVHLAGLWEFPGGKREHGEGWEDCLQRELREELGVAIRVGDLFEEVTFEYPGKIVRLRFYLARIVEGEPRAIGCAALKWVTSGELGDHPFPPADEVLLERLRAASSIWRE